MGNGKVCHNNDKRHSTLYGQKLCSQNEKLLERLGYANESIQIVGYLECTNQEKTRKPHVGRNREGKKWRND